MKQFAYYIIYLLTCISAVSCVETIVMDPHEEMPAVVYCVLTNKSDVQTLDLSAAESPSGVKPEIKAREVVVTATPGGRIAFEHAEGARWEAHFTPHWGTAYSLRIVLENGEELTAETSFRTVSGSMITTSTGSIRTTRCIIPICGTRHPFMPMSCSTRTGCSVKERTIGSLIIRPIGTRLAIGVSNCWTQLFTDRNSIMMNGGFSLTGKLGLGPSTMKTTPIRRLVHYG